MQQTSNGQLEEQENIVSVTPVSVTISGDNTEESRIPSIRVSADDQQRGPIEATESSATPSEGNLFIII